MATRTLTRTIALVAALACAAQVRAQGDLDILLRTVPPIVMIQFDTSGSMSNVVLPTQYLADRGTGSGSPPWVWFNTPDNDAVNRPAADRGDGVSPNNWVSVTSTGSSSEDYRSKCQIFPSTSTGRNASICFPGTSGCEDDDGNTNSVQANARIRCWDMPGASSGVCSPFVPASLQATCSTTDRSRNRTSGGALSRPYTTITLPDYSYGSQTTDYPVNYLWWMLNEIYHSRQPEFPPQDRLLAAKQAVTALVNQMNVDGQDPKVKFGLARYQSDNGGYVAIPASLTSKTAILTALDNVTDSTEFTANGVTPLSETLVDVARYLAGSSLFGTYPQYNRSTTGGTVTASSAPQSPITSQCEKVFIIVVTDGLPTSDNNDHYGSSRSTFLDTMSGFIDSDPNIPGSGGGAG
ncbi:MAG: hypothetical protein WEF50_21210, partial [Myxococcota bacterium]